VFETTTLITMVVPNWDDPQVSTRCLPESLVYVRTARFFVWLFFDGLKNLDLHESDPTMRHFFGPFLAPTESALVVSILGHEIHIVDLRCNGNSDAMSLVCAVGFLFQKEQKVD